MNGSLAANAALLDVIRLWPAKAGRYCAVCVPAPYLAQAQAFLAGSAVAWGSQDISRFEGGAYTGEFSARMVAEFGARYALVGHSERRAVFGDSDAVVAEKYARAAKAGLVPVLCVGETLMEREAGNTEAVVARQLRAVMDAHGVESLRGGVVAYEPVWAIGTGRTATPAQAQEVHEFLRSLVAKADAETAKALSMLYGGSVKNSNSAELFAMPDIDGGLIGGASLVAEEFFGIWNAL